MRLVVIVSSLILLSSATRAADKPNFSGKWTLNLVRSEYGSQAPPKQLTDVITHREPRLKIETVEVSPLDQEVRQAAEYTTNGKENTNTVLGNEVKSTAKWEGDTLVIDSRSSFAGRTVELNDRWRLVQGGKVILIDRTIQGPAGKFSQVIVLDKE
jgi:hypothetical protein